MSKEESNPLAYDRLLNKLIIGEIFETSRGGCIHVNRTSVAPTSGDYRSLGPKTIVKVVDVTPPHPEFPKRGYGPGVYVTPVNKGHKNHGARFYVPWDHIESGFLRKT